MGKMCYYGADFFSHRNTNPENKPNWMVAEAVVLGIS